MTKHEIYITPNEVSIDGKVLNHNENGAAMLTELYRAHVGDYPKFFKMDTLSKLGFVASELLLQAEGAERFVPREDRAVVFFNRSASLQADTAYQTTIQDPENFSPVQRRLFTPCRTSLRAKSLSETNILARPRSSSCLKTTRKSWHGNCKTPSSTR